MKTSEILKITKGRLLSGDPNRDIDPSKISTDSRSIGRAGFFIALAGPNFDGNEFVNQAFDRGAVGALISSRKSQVSATKIGGPAKNFGGISHKKVIIQAKDTLMALQAIAHHHRMNFDIPIIAVTGSNGKTTVKEMIACILQARYNVLKNEGTKNNNIGVSQTLLKLESEHDICVLELGANHKGEIRNLSDMTKPDMALITNIGPAHLEYLKDLDGVYQAKTEIFESLDRRNGAAILNGDDEYLSKVRIKGLKIIRFGFGESNDFRARMLSIAKNRLKFLLEERLKRHGLEFELNLLGAHNVYNALAATVVARQFGINYDSIKNALLRYRQTHMKLDLIKVGGIDVIDDSYNSNPLSMKGALEAIKYYPAKARWIVVGDMLELGSSSIHFHKMIGRAAAMSNANGLITLGILSKHALSEAHASGMDRNNLWHCSDHAEVAKVLKKMARRGDVVLVKGSRGMRMEEVIKRLE